MNVAAGPLVPLPLAAVAVAEIVPVPPELPVTRPVGVIAKKRAPVFDHATVEVQSEMERSE